MAMRRKTVELHEALHDYILETFVHEDDILVRLREETGELTMGRMQIAPDQGRMMAILARLIGARRAIEVGVFTGYSGLVVARALPEDGLLVACDVSEEWTAIARRYWAEAGVDGRIDLRLAPATETLDALIAAGEAGSYDMAFIDADKTNYDAYYERCLTLVRSGGLILVDNVLWGGSVVDDSDTGEDTAAIRALNAKMGADDRVASVILPIGDGVTLAIRT